MGAEGEALDLVGRSHGSGFWPLLDRPVMCEIGVDAEQDDWSIR